MSAFPATKWKGMTIPIPVDHGGDVQKKRIITYISSFLDPQYALALDPNVAALRLSISRRHATSGSPGKERRV